MNQLRPARWSFISRNSVIVAGVLLLHGGGLWALQSGLSRRVMADLVVPAEVLMDMRLAHADAASPQPPPPAAKATPTPTPRPVPAQATPTAPQPSALAATKAEPDTAALSPIPIPMPVAVAAATNTANANHVNAGTSTSTSTSSASPTAGTAFAANRAPALELPSSDAQYLNNPTPAYPALSKRLGEQGKVVIRTFIGADGIAQQAQIKQSSGYDRLDQAALATALKWRYVAGKRAGVAEAMWFDVPFTWILR